MADEAVKPKGRVNGHVRHKATRKAKAQSYLMRSTCIPCKAVFRSPKKRYAHVESGHKSMVGHNPKRQAKTAAII